MAALARLLLASWVVRLACGQCHERCSGHGECDLLGRCKCYDSYMVKATSTMHMASCLKAHYIT